MLSAQQVQFQHSIAPRRAPNLFSHAIYGRYLFSDLTLNRNLTYEDGIFGNRWRAATERLHREWPKSQSRAPGSEN